MRWETFSFHHNPQPSTIISLLSAFLMLWNIQMPKHSSTHKCINYFVITAGDDKYSLWSSHGCTYTHTNTLTHISTQVHAPKWNQIQCHMLSNTVYSCNNCCRTQYVINDKDKYVGDQGVSLPTCTFLCASANSSLWSGSHVFSFLSLVILSRSCFGYREKLPFIPMWYFPDGFTQVSGICWGGRGNIWV